MCLVVLDQAINTATPAGRMLFHVLAAIAEFEHDLISERTLDGLAASRARGRSGGRKPTLTDDQVRAAREMYDKKDRTVQQIADVLGCSRPTIYRALQKQVAA